MSASPEEPGRYPTLTPGADRIVRAMALTLIIGGGLYAIELPATLGIALFPQQFLGFALALALAVIFLVAPAGRGAPTRHVPWYDVVLAVLGLVVGLYIAIRYPKLAYEINFPTADKYVLGSLALLLALEASRRVYGWAVPVVAVLFVAYAAFANHFPGIFETRAIPWIRLSSELYLGGSGLIGIATEIVATVVLVFILFGHLLFAMGGGALFTDLASALMGRYRGGPAKVAVIGSAMFGSISGSAVANVVITGSVTIPLMKRLGYRPEVAGAVEAAASTGGIITPPVMGAVAFIMAELLQIPYGDIVLAATIPAILYYAAILFQVDLEAGARGMKGLPRDEIPRVAKVLRDKWPFVLPIPVLIFTLIGLYWEPTKAGMFSVLMLVVAGYWFVRDKPVRWWLGVLSGAGIAAAEIIAMGALVGVIIGSAEFTGLGFTLSLPLLQIGTYSLLLFLIVTAAISLVLGMGLPGIIIYLMQVALIVPALVEMGVTPLAAHFFIMYFGTFSMITPPVCISSIAAAAIARAEPMRTGWESVKLGIVAFLVPFLFVFSPSLLGQGPLWLVVVNTVTALLGVLAISVAIRGFFMTTVGVPVRGLLALAGLGLSLPVFMFDSAWTLNLIALALALALLAGNAWSARTTVTAAPRMAP